MFNSDHSSQVPSTPQLPTSAQLLRSTLIAIVVAISLLITTVLPGEYGIDPTGIGRMLGLTQMGEIKEQLAAENAKDRTMVSASIAVASVAPQTEVAAAAQPERPVVAIKEPVKPKVTAKQGAISIVLSPGQGAEVKLEMKEGAMVGFSWTANGGELNYDTHGDPYNSPQGFYHGYGKGRFQPSDKGVLKAAFDGNHGWFWRNRTLKDVTLTLEVSGEYLTMKRVL